LQLKNFAHGARSPHYSWKRMFVSVDPECQNFNRDQIIDRIFSRAYTEQLPLYLRTVKRMYQFGPHEEELVREFEVVCAAFGVNPSNL
jgi:hypothetical protein